MVKSGQILPHTFRWSGFVERATHVLESLQTFRNYSDAATCGDNIVATVGVLLMREIQNIPCSEVIGGEKVQRLFDACDALREGFREVGLTVEDAPIKI